MILSLVLYLVPFASVRLHRVDTDNKGRAVPVAVAQGVVTSVVVSADIDPSSVTLGDAKRYAIEVASPRQINIKVASAPMDSTTNLNLLTVRGDAVALALTVVRAENADGVVQVDVAGAAMCADKMTIHEHQTRLLRDISEGILLKSVDKRAMDNGIILKLFDFLRIGQRGYLRFSVQNRSRDPWTFGTASINIAVDNKRPFALETSVHTAASVLQPGDETRGGIGILLYDLPQEARYSMQVMEKAGTRHVNIDKFQL